MKLLIAPVLVLATCSLTACSSSPLSGVPESDGSGAAPAGAAGARAGGVPPTSNWAAYPPGPYGTGRGATIENLSFTGWKAPAEVGYDPQKFETVRLSDFYDPDGHTGIKLLAINASAVWCSVCRAEYADMNANQVYSKLRPLGLEILGTLFEDNAYYPAQPQDLKNWGVLSSHSVQFPLVLDPGFKLGAYFDSDATPLNMLVDVRTMTIVKIDMGIPSVPSTYWTGVQAMLEKM